MMKNFLVIYAYTVAGAILLGELIFIVYTLIHGS